MTECRTPGAIYRIYTGMRTLHVTVEFNRDVEMTEEEAAELHERIHTALEGALAPLYNNEEGE